MCALQRDAATRAEKQPYLARQIPMIRLSRYQAKFVCEGIGTFIFLMTTSLAEMNCGNLAVDGKTRTRNLAPIAEGFMLCVLIFMFGYISGGHFNPAVTFAVVMIRGMRVEEAISYWVAQVVGALVGAGLSIFVHGSTQHLPAPQVVQNTAEYVFSAFVAEAVFTMLLVTVVLHAAYSQQRNNDFYGLAVGMCLLASQYAVGGVSGGAFNPAVATGLQVTKFIAAGYFTQLLYLWLYWAAPACGAVAAAFLFMMTHPVPKDEAGEVQQQRVARNLYSSF
ncbi:aquaporin-like protein [Leishmania donovani]|uniref:Aquaporin-like protein n=1 Tax=Leishmania donovani TaxID=5661 RepID=E9BP02_LEIDO|nr:aquaporin-like protein [Leishmania donovani]TPP43760.1 Major intrinsic family protein [Leishmania donovani]CBZ36980.1 aquaporin-like protein [Leishmania donovani]